MSDDEKPEGRDTVAEEKPEKPEGIVISGDKLVTAGKIAGAIGGIIGLIATVWGGIAKVNNLIEEVHRSAQAVEAARADIRRVERESQVKVDRVVDAMRDYADRNAEIVTNLRIAVAALEAAEQVPRQQPAQASRDLPSGFGTFGAGSSAAPAASVRSDGTIRLPTQPAELRAEARRAIDRAGGIASQGGFDY